MGQDCRMADRRTMEDTVDERGSSHRWLALRDSGALDIAGQDIGPMVERFFGEREYEFARTVAAGAVPRLREALGIGPGDDLLDAICARFSGPGSSAELERWIAEQGIETEFWSRTGD
jgi:hypothetical protein